MAKFTRRVLPPRFRPSMLCIADSASAGDVKLTNPNPLDRPVSRSITTFASITSPKEAKASLRVFSSVPHERPPTKSLEEAPDERKRAKAKRAGANDGC